MSPAGAVQLRFGESEHPARHVARVEGGAEHGRALARGVGVAAAQQDVTLWRGGGSWAKTEEVPLDVEGLAALGPAGGAAPRILRPRRDEESEVQPAAAAAAADVAAPIGATTSDSVSPSVSGTQLQAPGFIVEI